MSLGQGFLENRHRVLSLNRKNTQKAKSLTSLEKHKQSLDKLKRGNAQSSNLSDTAVGTENGDSQSKQQK